ncbi:unnamed protein product [Closterium sp. NIES-65]|nr:unnamed protein product [Closterium sp. NIES-65]
MLTSDEMKASLAGQSLDTNAALPLCPAVPLCPALPLCPAVLFPSSLLFPSDLLFPLLIFASFLVVPTHNTVNVTRCYPFPPPTSRLRPCSPLFPHSRPEHGQRNESLLRILKSASPPSPTRNTVNVTRWFQDDLKLKEEDSDLLFPLSPLPTPSPPTPPSPPLLLPSPSPTLLPPSPPLSLPSSPPLPLPEHGERDQVVPGGPAVEGGGLGRGEDGYRGVRVGDTAALAVQPSPPRLPPSPSQNMVNVTRWLLENLQLNEEDSVVVKIDIEGWLLEDLQLKEEDSVVVKMDIEGYEWEILQHWISNPCMAAIVDELFVEVHYHHPSMTEFMWTEEYFIHTRDDATRLLTDLRKAGFYVHPWP